MTFEEAKSLLEKKNQLQVLTYYEELSSDEKESLLKQVGELDWKLLDKFQHLKKLEVQHYSTELQSHHNNQ